MIELSVIRDLVAIFGVIAGFTYYVLTVRNTRKALKTQTLMRLRDRSLNKEWLSDFIELLETEWTDYDDFLRKYDSSVNRDIYTKRARMWAHFDSVGYHLSQGLIDIDSVYHLTQSMGASMQWRKWKPVIEEQRKRYNNPDWWMWFEYLNDEITKYRVARGHPPETTDVDGFFQSCARATLN
jgi:hypothetical protein